jgi:DNA-binding transcriptional MerR regulator
MSSEKLTIGEAARLLGMTPRAIRQYERLGLLEEPERSAAGYRLYGARELLRLRELGLPLRRIGGLLEGPEAGMGLRPMLEALLGEVESRIRELERRRAAILEAWG